ncbi:HTTM domain-containing protein [Anatilimnocola floriformis]|uniref:HTTM domain-containing protein n=1 Tax=Anatilimnocola floriformis TaxID=2948575 RepID=UPI0020C4C788|nr:HTTM domain-containing protein [Anatilimnocola floriformis]
MSNDGISLAQFWGKLSTSWTQFLNAPIDARRFALVRIGFALVILIYLAVLYPDLETWYGPTGLYPPDVDEAARLPQQWSVLRWLPTDPNEASEWMQNIFWIHIACTLMLLVGFCSRVNALIVYVLLVSWQHRNPLILDAEDSVFCLVGFFLLLMPSGRAWSVDRLLWNRNANETCPLAPAWPLRLLQLQMVVIFVSAALFKLGGTPWWDGSALSYVIRLDDTFGRFSIPAWPFEMPILVRLMTWTVVAVELFAPLLVWFRETRRWALLLIVLFHLSNEYAMCLFLFHWIMLVGWSTFLTSADFSALWNLLPRSGGSARARV